MPNKFTVANIELNRSASTSVLEKFCRTVKRSLGDVQYEKRNKETKIQESHIKRRRFGGREVGRFIEGSRGNQERQKLLDEAILRLKLISITGI